MKGKVRDLFPGGNTSKGFYSYYQYILGQKEAKHIVCIKGGPGTGKSSFMKTIADHFINNGEDVDLFRCSSDPDSLDGILLKGRHIAFMDGTSPHVIDPQNPGAVDTILNLGDYWDIMNLKACKNNIIKSNSIIKKWFECAYENLKAAGIIRALMTAVYGSAVYEGELYKLVQDIIVCEMKDKPVTISEGECRKYFASAITHKGNLTYIKSLLKDYKKIYLFSVPVGFDTGSVMMYISENAVHRGFSIEQYYCPMEPSERIEHVLVPEIETAFVTLNDYHDMESRECSAEIYNVDLREYIDWNAIEKYSEVIEHCSIESDRLIEQAILYLKKAKQEHDVLEEYYVSNMNFDKIENLADEWICKIECDRL